MHGKITCLENSREVFMPTPQINTLASFHQFVGQQLASEDTAQMSPELAIAIWREREETLDAIREGLADVEAGRTFPAEEVIRQLRAELHEA
jgi:predicted transcriptional regulator